MIPQEILPLALPGQDRPENNSWWENDPVVHTSFEEIILPGACLVSES